VTGAYRTAWGSISDARLWWLLSCPCFRSVTSRGPGMARRAMRERLTQGPWGCSKRFPSAAKATNGKLYAF